MYCLDIGSDGNNKPHVMAIQTVKDEQSKFSNIDCTWAEAIRKLQEVLACPSNFDLANAVEDNIIGNNPFTRRDVRIAKQIYGPDVAALKGKTVKQQSKMPREDEANDILLSYTWNAHTQTDRLMVSTIQTEEHARVIPFTATAITAHSIR
jgi:hypothetical protein